MWVPRRVDTSIRLPSLRLQAVLFPSDWVSRTLAWRKLSGIAGGAAREVPVSPAQLRRFRDQSQTVRAVAGLAHWRVIGEALAEFGHDPQRTGWAYEETMLSPENVSTLELKWKTKVKNEFRMLSALTVPVVAIGVPTLKGVRDVVYVAGSGDHVFALDAETGEVLWTRSFKSYVGPKNSGYQETFLCPNGITATPVIDRSTS